MRIYGIEDELGIYKLCKSPAEVPEGDSIVELVENLTWEQSDYTDSKTGKNYIRIERQSEAFDKLCKSTGIKKKDLAKICGKSAVSFTKYCSGLVPIPKLVWDKVKEFERKELR